MFTQAMSSGHRASRWMLLIAVAGALLLTAGVAVRTAHAGGPATINLDPGDVNTNSQIWKDGPGCDPASPQYPGAGLVMWQFELVGVSPGFTSALTLNVAFSGDGAMLIGSTWNGAGTTHTWFAYTSGNDVVTSASVVVPNTAGTLSLVEICHGPEPTPAASLQNAATSPTQPSAPILVFFGILLAALAGVAGMRVLVPRAER